MPREGGTCLVLQPPLFPGLEGSVWDLNVEGSDEAFQLLQGRRGIFKA